MSRRLEINIEDIQKQQIQEDSGSEQEKWDKQQQQSEQYEIEENQEQQQHHDEKQFSEEERFQQQSINSRLQDSIETFGNHLKNKDLIRELAKINNKQHNHFSHKRQQYPLLDMPIEMDQNNSNRTMRNLQQSNIDDEIQRIINKVRKQSVSANLHKPAEQYKKQIQQLKRIDRINKGLLSQNTQLISQITQLQKKLGQINQRITYKKNIQQSRDKSLSICEDKDIIKQIKKYRQKLSKALNLNSKLSSRLNTEKSRSQVISNTFRSIISKQEQYADSGISTIKTSTIRDDSKHQKHSRSKKSSNLYPNGTDVVYCDKCCKQVKQSENISQVKQLILSPVLQVKNYEISARNVANEFSLSGRDIPHHHRKDAQCQANARDNEWIYELQKCQNEQAELQKLIKANNEKIERYEESLMHLIDIN